MKKVILFSLICLSCAIGKNFCIFDANGNCVSILNNVRDAQNISQKSGYKKYYIAEQEKNIANKFSYKSVNPTKTEGRKLWYEVDWNQGVKLCPENHIDAENGVWIVNGSAHVDSLNCLYVDGSPYTRSILARFAKNKNDLKNADSSWILVNQTIVNLKGNKYTIYRGIGRIDDRNLKDSAYVVQMGYDLIVDKTELRVRDALWLREGEKINKNESVLLFNEDYYPSVDSLNILDYPSQFFRSYLNFRSKKDGLENIWTCHKPTQCTYNESANGYRLPSYDEWYVLQNAGQSSVFSWGNEFVEDSLKKYASIRCVENKSGIYPVKQYAPNQLGLYDTYGNANEKYYEKFDDSYYSATPCSVLSSNNPGKACRDLFKYKCLSRSDKNDNASYIKNGFQGMRMVRVLE